VIGLLLAAGLAGGLYWLLRPLPPEPVLRQPEPRPGPSTSEQSSTTPDLGGLIRAGRLDEAFALVQERLGAGAPPPVEEIWALAQALRGAGRLDQAFALTRELANGGHGPAAFALAEMYDPLHWSSDRSPFSRSNGAKARDWYRRAAASGVAEAEGRIRALDASEGVP
jgi:serine/threonine-protein kinase